MLAWTQGTLPAIHIPSLFNGFLPHPYSYGTQFSRVLNESAQTLNMDLGSSQHQHDKMTSGSEEYQRLSLKLKSPVFLDKSQAGLRHIPEGGEQLSPETLMMPKLGLKEAERSWINSSFKQTEPPGK